MRHLRTLGCCGDPAGAASRTMCWVDQKSICNTGGDYQPEKIITSRGLTGTCDAQILANQKANKDLENVDFAAIPFNCDTYSSAAGVYVRELGGLGCCGANYGKTACHVDFSHICTTPADYLPEKNIGDGGTCDGQMYADSSPNQVLASEDFSSTYGENLRTLDYFVYCFVSDSSLFVKARLNYFLFFLFCERMYPLRFSSFFLKKKKTARVKVC